MMKKLYSILAILLMVTLLFPITVKAETTSMPIVSKKVIYQDENYTIEVTTIIEQETITTYGATGLKTASKVYEVKNMLGNVVATYTLKGNFRYDGTSATCTSATYSTSIESSLWSFEDATAYASGAKALGSFTATTLLPPQTVSQEASITCSSTGVIS